MLTANQLELVRNLDVSREIANSLYDPDFEANLRRVQPLFPNERSQSALTSYDRLGSLFRKHLAALRADDGAAGAGAQPGEVARNQSRSPRRADLPAQDARRICCIRLRGRNARLPPGRSRGVGWSSETRRDWGRGWLRRYRRSAGRLCLAGSIDLQSPEVVATLLQESSPQTVVFLGSADGAPAGGDVAATAERWTLAVLHLAQALARQPAPARLYLVTRGAQVVGPGDAVCPAQTALWGVGRAIALEYPQIWGGLIDLPAADDSGDPVSLVTALSATDAEDQAALRDGKYHVARLQQTALDAAIPPMALSGDATYLITGGLGGLGLLTAQRLVDAVRGTWFSWGAPRCQLGMNGRTSGTNAPASASLRCESWRSAGQPCMRIR